MRCRTTPKYGRNQLPLHLLPRVSESIPRHLLIVDGVIHHLFHRYSLSPPEPQFLANVVDGDQSRPLRLRLNIPRTGSQLLEEGRDVLYRQNEFHLQSSILVPNPERWKPMPDTMSLIRHLSVDIDGQWYASHEYFRSSLGNFRIVVHLELRVTITPRDFKLFVAQLRSKLGMIRQMDYSIHRWLSLTFWILTRGQPS